MSDTTHDTTIQGGAPDFLSVPHLDVHTHNRCPEGPAIVHVEAVPGMTALPDAPRADVRYSLGVHPWNAGRPDVAEALESQRHLAESAPTQLAAIGECGLDRLRGPGLDVQKDVFMTQARLAARLRLPLIVHCVRAWGELLAARRRLLAESGTAGTAEEPVWIVHGFRGKPALARQLLDAGMHLSFGPRHNPASLAITPPNRCHRESDEDF